MAEQMPLWKEQKTGTKTRKINTLALMPTFRHIHWLQMPLKLCATWNTAVATSIYGDKRSSTVKLGRHADPRSSALAVASQYSATQPDLKQHRRLHSSHSRKPFYSFHSSAHGPQCSDKTTCWRMAPNSMCHGLECFSFCACHRGGYPAATLNWFPEYGDTSAVLLERKWKTTIFVREWLQLCSGSS